MTRAWRGGGGIARLGWGLACLGAGACFGEPEPADSAGTTEDASGTAAMDDSGGGNEAENLLTNGSFESWGGGAPIAWTPTEDTTVVEAGDAFEGRASMEVHVEAYGEVRQRIDLPAPIPAGTVSAVQMAYRYVEGDASPPGIDVHGIRADEQSTVVPAIVTPTFAPSGWTEGGGNVTTEEEFVAIQISLVAGGVGPQVVLLDDVRVSILD